MNRTRTTVATPTTTLLEREQPLAQLADALQTATQGQGSVVLVTGEPGIGKTALVTAFSTAVAGRARVLTGICDDLATPRTLGAFRDLATSWSPRVAEVLQE
ncbi:MAG TPA: AAA family ATPase, partial [Ornithinimicrobium sp.]|nr:AAA family ATPase [Ornithinimicrobium sp.]